MLALLLFFQAVQPDTADSIMAKVAANQDRAQTARTAYVYNQELLTRMLRPNSKLAREERREYVVTPTEKGATKDLSKFTGKYERNGKLYEYDHPSYRKQNVDIDGELIESLAEDLVNDKESKDGIATDLFPLTTEEQVNYTFKLEETKKYRGRDVYRITFQPKDKEEFGWAGEALIDTHEYQPVSVTTHMARGIPWAIKAFLGINLRQFGFSVGYKPVEDGIWFPVTYGTECRLELFWGYKRVITMAMTSSNFKKADVQSTIEYQTNTEK
jgi:hypothetical protein